MQNTQIKETLRAQYDHRKGMWKIMKKTYNGAGGWKRFGDAWHYDRDDADAAIKRIINNRPEMYCEG